MITNTLFNRFLVELQSHLPHEDMLRGQPPEVALTIQANNPEPGNIQVWDDGIELTVGIGSMFHCHFDSTMFEYLYFIVSKG